MSTHPRLQVPLAHAHLQTCHLLLVFDLVADVLRALSVGHARALELLPLVPLLADILRLIGRGAVPLGQHVAK